MARNRSDDACRSLRALQLSGINAVMLNIVASRRVAQLAEAAASKRNFDRREYMILSGNASNGERRDHATVALDAFDAASGEAA